MNNYYTALSRIDFFKLHPSYIPFVGNLYDEYKILQISESHYSDIMDTKVYGIEYFSKWFDEKCPEVEVDILNNKLTRRVCEGVCNGCNRFSNFDNPLRSFMKVVLDIENPHTNKQTRPLYHHFAYMNFYQMLAFEAKGYFKKSFYNQAEREGLTKTAENLLDRCRQVSTNVVDQVIDVLEPKAIVFTSIDAWEQYICYSGKYIDDNRMIYSTHPGRPWNSKQNKLNGRTGKDVFEARLRELYK